MEIDMTCKLCQYWQGMLLLWEFELHYKRISSKARYLHVNSWTIRETNQRSKCTKEYIDNWMIRACKIRKIRY